MTGNFSTTIYMKQRYEKSPHNKLCGFYTTSIYNTIRNKSNLIVMHTHPNSMPPSIADFNSCFEHNYVACFVICHDGTIYQYISSQKVPPALQYLYIQDFLKITYNERDAQIMALEKIKESYDINFQEVI